MTVSVLTPTRGRPEMCAEMLLSSPTAEHVLWLDDDDDKEAYYKACNRMSEIDIVWRVGPRQPLGKVWNQLAEVATGEYLMLGNDDLLWRTPEWEQRLRETVDPSEVKVAYFDDGLNAPGQLSIPCMTRAWYECLGYFVPEHFSFGYVDTWVFDVAHRADAWVYLKDVLIEHLHPSRGKRERDRTYSERKWGNDAQIFGQTEKQRIADAERVRAARET